jgi:hypothetical protein
MSAWYVMSAMGLYPVCPGKPEYVISSPLFEKITIHLENGRKFSIHCEDLSPYNKYIRSAVLNGRDHPVSWIDHATIINGGELVIQMAPEPGKNWGKAPSDRPGSSIDTLLITPVPFINEGSMTFLDSIKVSLGCLDPTAEILFTVDDSDPTIKGQSYQGYFSVHESVPFRMIARLGGLSESKELATFFKKIPPGRSLKLHSSYSNQYAAGGDLALIDLVRGGNDFKTGTWQGYQGVGIDAEVDLGKIQHINSLSVGFLQDNNAWIFMPEEVRIMISNDGQSFTDVPTITRPIPPEQEGVIIMDFIFPVEKKARYIKVNARNMGNCPPWHKGAGGKAWIFADEIVIE